MDTNDAHYNRELENMSVLSHHDGIVQYISSEQIDEYSIIVMEYYSGGCLASFILDGFYKIDLVCPIVKDIFRTLSRIHNDGYIYCDLKPRNIMLDRRYNEVTVRPVLIDLGSVVKMGESVIEYTKGYANGLINQPASIALDMQCLCVVLFELCKFRIPVDEEELQEFLQQDDEFGWLCREIRRVDTLEKEKKLLDKLNTCENTTASS